MRWKGERHTVTSMTTVLAALQHCSIRWAGQTKVTWPPDISAADCQVGTKSGEAQVPTRSSIIPCRC